MSAVSRVRNPTDCLRSLVAPPCCCSIAVPSRAIIAVLHHLRRPSERRRRCWGSHCCSCAQLARTRKRHSLTPPEREFERSRSELVPPSLPTLAQLDLADWGGTGLLPALCCNHASSSSPLTPPVGTHGGGARRRGHTRLDLELHYWEEYCREWFMLAGGQGDT